MSVNMAAREQTFIMIKPDAVQRGLVGDIIKRYYTNQIRVSSLLDVFLCIELSCSVSLWLQV
jgi:nucleoside diphosphate kinase